MRDQLVQGLQVMGLAHDSEHIEGLERYVELLLRWNERFNLTAITRRDEILTKHLFDSLAVLNLLRGNRVADIGTGAGLPGLLLALFAKDKTFHLVDTNSKKIRFIRQAAHDMKIENVYPIHSRVENFSGHFDVVISRAFTSCMGMIAACDHLLPKGSYLQMMKGLIPNDELQRLPQSYSLLATETLMVPGLDAQRHLITLEKVADL